MFKSLRVLASAASAVAFANTIWDALSHFHCPDGITFVAAVAGGVLIPAIIHEIYIIEHEERY